MHRLRLLAAVVLLGGAPILLAQPTTLTLEQVKQIALERNLNVVQAQNNVSAAQSQVLSAYGTYLPTVSASGGWSRTQSDRASNTTAVIGGQPIVVPGQFSVTNNFNTGLSANLVLFDGFSRSANVSAASSRAILSEQTASRTRQAIAFQAVSDYLNVLRNEQLVRVSEENLKRDRRQLERIVESNRVGALSLADVYRQQSQVASDELDVITAQNEYDKSKADLAALAGLDVSQDYRFEDPSIPTELDSTRVREQLAGLGSFEEISSRAIAARPDYMGAVENLDAAESGVTSARGGYFPTVSASAGYSLFNEEFKGLSNNKNLNWGVGFRWSLFDGFQTNQAIQTASAQRRNAEITLSQAERDINVQIKKALLDLDAARKSLEVSQKGLVSAAEDRKIAEERYNLGAGTLLDLMVANANFVRAEAQKVNATYGFITATYNLEFVIGERTY
jgi:outer membrane protein